MQMRLSADWSCGPGSADPQLCFVLCLCWNALHSGYISKKVTFDFLVAPYQ